MTGHLARKGQLVIRNHCFLFSHVPWRLRKCVMTTAQPALHLKRRPQISSQVTQLLRTEHQNTIFGANLCMHILSVPLPNMLISLSHFFTQTNHLHLLIDHFLWTSPVAQGPAPCDVRLENASYLLSSSIRGWPANTLRQTVWQRLDFCPNNSKGKYSKWFIKLSSRKLKSPEIMSVTALAGCCGDRGAVTFRHVLFPILAHGSNW